MKNIPQACRPSYLWFWPPLILGGSAISAGTIHDLRRIKVPGTGPLWNPWTSLSTHISNFDDIRQCWIFAVLWWPFWKWQPVEKNFNGRNQFWTSLSTHISNFDDIRQCWIVAAILKMVTGRIFSISGHHYLPTYKILMISDNIEFLLPIFYAMFWQPFWKWQTSLISHLEVININVRNFNFPIGFYSNPHPLWTSQNMTLTPFTTKLKTLGPTRNIYL